MESVKPPSHAALPRQAQVTLHRPPERGEVQTSFPPLPIVACVLPSPQTRSEGRQGNRPFAFPRAMRYELAAKENTDFAAVRHACTSAACPSPASSFINAALCNKLAARQPNRRPEPTLR
jgi:hypothetical protein